MTPFAALLFKIMVSLAPLSNHYNETPEQASIRYESIASDIDQVVHSEASPFDDDDKRAKIGILLVIISSTESGSFDKDVDMCRRNGDHGTSFTIFQLSNAYAPSHQICQDRKLAVHWAIKAITQSMEACKRQGLPYYSRLSVYSTGRCILNETYSVKRLRKLDKALKDYSTDIDSL